MDNIPEHFRQRIQEVKEKKLEELDLSNNYQASENDKLTKIPEEVFELKYLKVLNLNRNRISELPESIGNLSSLTRLFLRENQISELPESIGNLSSLTRLFLRGNKISELPESIGNLTNLIGMFISENQILELPESIGNLTNLTWLDLSKNKIPELPESIGDLTNLIWLNLSENKISELPESLINLNHLCHLSLLGNIITDPPIEIAKQGIEKIRDYFRQLKEEGEDYIYEAKLIIIGEAGAGKTTLAKKIYNPDYQLQETEASTEGIEIIKYSFPFLDKEKETRYFKVNIWDFGGQEIYHATHQFFLTKRSLYILVADTRKEDTDLYYWLNVVELLSDNSPLLIIKNEKQDRKREINENSLRGEFTNLGKTLATNLATNRGLEETLTHIKHYIQELPHIGDILPKTWVKVRQALEKDYRNYISLQEYLDICAKNGFKLLRNKLQLSEYLHDLGVCLHFQDEEDSLLYKTVILKPEWGTEAVYKVLDNKQVINNQGCFTRNDLKNIWHEEKYALMRGELLELMKKFQLCYEIPGNKDTFIAPQLLSDNQPEYVWDESNNLVLRYTYPDFMPKGIVTRFVVVMHQYIDQQKYVWKSGVILNKDNTKAEVIEYYGKREIRIRVSGNNKRNFMTVLTNEIDKINNSFKRLKYHKLIPCNCEVCKYIQLPHFYSYETLQKFMINRQGDIQCQESFQMINVFTLIDDVLIWQKINATEESKDYSTNQNQSLVSITFQNPKQQQVSDNTMTNINQTHSGSGDNVAGDKNITNNYNSQDLTQAAAEIQALLQQLSATNPTTTNREKMAVAGEAVDIIEAKPALKTKVINALKAGGTEAFKEAVNHPLVNVFVAMIEGWQEES